MAASNIMETEDKPMNTKELSQAVSLLLEREEARDQQQRRRARKRIRRRREAIESGVSQLAYSIEVIKWCIVGITTVMILSLVILIFVVLGVKGELVKVNVEVQRIQREAEIIRDKIRHPLESLGATMGRRLEGNLGDNLGGEEKSAE
jgi:hypothetical protein